MPKRLKNQKQNGRKMTKTKISRIRAAAGRLGGKARWAGVEHKPTEKIRVYCEDADRLRAMPGTMAAAVHAAVRRLKG